ncbi:PaaI family thioesterase [Nocardioides sp.]|uniref:PaaI family thioesterase n=1 Tax=Nocardioides sp. TaxID=35761 RepID=UPI00199BB74C|nr:PaaI family thioesterase [Nocardioides sp.]MBC7278579.1 PaaI family thioesterase [Nocardioides sp.]
MAETPAVTASEAEEILANQPFSRLIGVEVGEVGYGHATLRIPLREELLQQFGTVHGGVLSYAADNALAFAGGTILGPHVLTRGFSIDFLRPSNGDHLRAYAEVINHTSRNALTRCEVFTVGDDGTEVLVAAAQGSIARIDR